MEIWLIILPIGISLVALVVTLIVTPRQLRDAKSARQMAVLTDVLGEFRSEEFKAHQAYVYDAPPHALVDQGNATGLSDEALGHVRPVMHFYDNLGLLVVEGIVDERPILAFLGRSSIRTWRILQPYIAAYRAIHGPYQVFFEDLAARAQARAPEAILKDYRLRKFHPESQGDRKG